MPSFDVEKFCLDHHILTHPAGSKNVPSGCVGISCPFCGDSSNHMHFRLGTFAVKCWRCGKHRVVDAVGSLLRVPEAEARAIVARYVSDVSAPLQPAPPRVAAEAVKWPGGTGTLMEIHQRYLLDRLFDPFKIEREWGVRGTNHIDPNYKFRLIAPILFNHQIISYQARDVTGQQIPKYRACPPEHEVMSHKDVLYGYDKAIGSSIVIVEGITDVWRLGAGAVATFGTKWTTAQALQIVQHPSLNRVFVLFDPDEAGQLGGTELYHFLRGFMENVELLQLEGFSDPGSMPQSEARYLMIKELHIK